jgi:hypothetical protein
MRNLRNSIKSLFVLSIVTIAMSSCHSSKGGGCGYWGNSNESTIEKPVQQKTFIVHSKCVDC